MDKTVIRLPCTCYLSEPSIEGRKYCKPSDRCATIHNIKWAKPKNRLGKVLDDE